MRSAQSIHGFIPPFMGSYVRGLAATTFENKPRTGELGGVYLPLGLPYLFPICRYSCLSPPIFAYLRLSPPISAYLRLSQPISAYLRLSPPIFTCASIPTKCSSSTSGSGREQPSRISARHLTCSTHYGVRGSCDVMGVVVLGGGGCCRCCWEWWWRWWWC